MAPVEGEVQVIQEKIGKMREDITDVKAAIGLLTLSVNKIMSVEEKFQAERENRQMLQGKYEALLEKVNCMAPVFEWSKEHRLWFEKSFKSLAWKAIILALVGWGMVGIIGYGIYHNITGKGL